MDRGAGRTISKRQLKTNQKLQNVTVMSQYRPEVEVFEGKVCLDNSCGLHSGPQDVLLCGLVVCRTNPI